MIKRIHIFPLFGLIWAFLAMNPASAGAQPMGGVGVTLDFHPQDPKQVLVYSVSYKSPADKVKIRRGDRLLKVDGADVAGVGLPELAKKIQGPVGSSVTLTVQSQRGGVQDFTLIRAPLSKGPVVTLPPPGQAAPAGTYFTPEEKALLRQKIMALKTDEQREKMLNLLKALKEKKITKQAFLKFLKTDF